MILDLQFTWEEKIKFLQELGYEIKEQVESVAHDVHHNDVEYEDVKIFAVYFLGMPFEKPNFRNQPTYDAGRKWVDQVFNKIIYHRLKNFLLTNEKSIAVAH